MEYVSAESYRKDYRESFRKYERELKVPYCLLFYPEEQDLQVHHLQGRRYRRLPATEQGRYAIPELDLEVGLWEGWVRFWYQGKLLPLPTELERIVEAEKDRADREKNRADQEKSRADQEKNRADQEKNRADQEKNRADQLEAEVARLRGLVP